MGRPHSLPPEPRGLSWADYPPIKTRLGSGYTHPRRGHVRDGYVYVVAFAEWVKVGFTAHPERRIYNIRQCMPTEVRVLYVVRARLAVERKLLPKLARWRAKGEWFTASPGCMEMIRAALFGGRS